MAKQVDRVSEPSGAQIKPTQQELMDWWDQGAPVPETLPSVFDELHPSCPLCGTVRTGPGTACYRCGGEAFE